MIVTIGTNRYVVANDKDGHALVRQRYVVRQSNPQRLIGTVFRENDPSMGHYVFRDFPLGIGWARSDRNTGRGVGGALFATAGIRFGTQTLQLLAETQTHAAPTDHPRGRFLDHAGEVWAFLEDDYIATRPGATFAASFNASTDTWLAVNHPQFNASSGGSATAGTVTVAHTVQSTFGNRIIIAFAESDTDDATGVTYAGVAMTRLGVATQSGNISLWYLIAPATGANNCVGTWADPAIAHKLAVADYYGVNQTTPIGAAATETGAAGAATTVTPAGDRGDLNVGGTAHDAAEAVTPGAGQTERQELQATAVTLETSDERNTGGDPAWTATWATATNFRTIAAALQGNNVITSGVADASGQRVFAVGTHKGNLIAVTNSPADGAGAGSERAFEILRNADPAAGSGEWTSISLTGWPDNTDLTTTVTRRNNFDDAFAAMVDEGNILLVALYFDASGTTDADAIRVYETSDLGANWALTATIDGVGETPMGFHRWRDPTNLAVVTSVLVTNYNLYKIDSSANTATPLLPAGVLSGNVNDARANTIGLDGSMYLSLASGDHLKLTLAAENQIVVENIGPATGQQVNGKFEANDGLPAAFAGRSNFCLDTPSDWMYWAYGGHAASTNATVLAYSKSRKSWYVMYDDPTANVDLYLLGYTTESDGIPRLFIVEEGAAAAVMTHREYPNTPVTAGQTQNYEASSYIRHPVDSQGDPRTNKGYFHALMDADNLSATAAGEYIQLQDGVDGEVDTTNNRGNFLSGTLTLATAPLVLG